MRHRRRRNGWILAAVVAAVLSACGADESSDSADPAASAPGTAASSVPGAWTTISSATTSTTAVTSSTSVATPTVATTTSVNPTTTAESTASPSSTVRTPSTPGDRAVIDLATDGPFESPAVFGFEFANIVDVGSVLATVEPVLGAPDDDTGWQPMPESLACSGALEYRSILWDDLRFVFTGDDLDGDDVVDRVLLWAWSIGETELMFSPPLDAVIEKASGLTTTSGLGLGSPREAIFEEDFDMVGDDEGVLYGLSGVSPVVFEIEDGRIAAMSIQVNDCFSDEGL